MFNQSKAACIHGLHYRTCAHCNSGWHSNGVPTSERDDDDQQPRFVVERSWGGTGMVRVMGKDDKPVKIPHSMEYMHTVGGNERLAQKISAIAYSWIPKTAERKGFGVPDFYDREDIAQSAVLAFMEWAKGEDDVMAALHDVRQLCYMTGAAYMAWVAERFKRPDIRPIDWETGVELNIPERWAEPGMYLPLMALLKKAKDASDPTPEQQALIDAWRMFDPELEGRMTRDLKAEPLDPAERKRLQRVRALLLNPKEATVGQKLSTKQKQERAEAARSVVSDFLC